MNHKGSWSKIRASKASMRTSNPIRQIVDQIDPSQSNKEKSLISLSIGDPTVFGNLATHENVIQAILKSVQSGQYNGYAHASGYKFAREVIAKKYSLSNHLLTDEDVILTSGCSGAIEMCIGALANEGDNILIPSPGFSLYKTVCDNKGIECKFYRLKAEEDWEADLEHMKSLINERTRAILINNPSNPCGSVFRREHILDILKVAEEYCLPIISDEIYAHITFEKDLFISIAELTDTVPILVVGGIAKQYLVPGWRLGWILIYDKQGYFHEIRQGLARLATIILGPNTIVQGALNYILNDTPESFYLELNRTLKENADYTVERISKIPGLKVVRPQGAMYCMVGIEVDKFDNSLISDDVTFSKMLLKEESVLVLPGQCFRMSNFFRIVLCPPLPKLKEAYDRLEQFCLRYYKA